MEVSPSLVSEVAEAVMEEAWDWQSRALELIYPILYLVADGENAVRRGGWRT
ncbi:MAG: transposase [Bryobacterales bacterium]|nr:transposase [Bryobacterales bacterium]